MKVKEMRTKSTKELSTLLTDLRSQLAQAHIDMRVKQDPNVKQIHHIKRDIARVLTLQQEAEAKEMEKGNE